LLVAPEQAVVLAKSLLDLIVARKALAIAQAQLAASFALGGGPIGKPVLRDQARRGLRNTDAISLGIQGVGTRHS
jgi:hypothetical protein